MTAHVLYKYGENPVVVQHFDVEEWIKYGWHTEPQNAPAFDADLKSAETQPEEKPKKLKATEQT